MEDGNEFKPENGYIFGDGSCYSPTNRMLSRAGWAFVQVDGEGNILKAIYGCVPAAIVQTSLAAEHFAFWAAFENARSCVYVGDCLHVLSCFNDGFKAILTGPSPHADFCKSALSRTVDVGSRFTSVKKIKAHKTLTQTIEAGESVADFHGNAQADALAKEGAAMHPSVDHLTIAYNRRCKEVTELALHMIDCLASNSKDRLRRFGKLSRLPKGFAVSGSFTPKGAHNMVWNGKIWICVNCLLRTSNPSTLPPGRLVCRGVKSQFVDLVNGQGNHSLWMCDCADGTFLLFCDRCWCYASTVIRNLGKDCCGTGSSIPCAKSFLARGLHPISKTPFLGRPTRLHCQSSKPSTGKKPREN